jgi:hypothetical protein
LDNAIRLRWALPDIKGKRLKLTPVDPNMRTLIDMGYVEMIDDVPRNMRGSRRTLFPSSR